MAGVLSMSMPRAETPVASRCFCVSGHSLTPPTHTHTHPFAHGAPVCVLPVAADRALRGVHCVACVAHVCVRARARVCVCVCWWVPPSDLCLRWPVRDALGLQGTTKINQRVTSAVAGLGAPGFEVSEACHGILSGCLKGSAESTGCPASFPMPIDQAAAFNESLWNTVAKAISEEGRTLKTGGVNGVNFGAKNSPCRTGTGRWHCTSHCTSRTRCSQNRCP